jgi:hypothetical protein
MTTDPAPWIIFAALLGAMIGFFGCAIIVSRRIREAERESYWEGYYAANRENNAHTERELSATQSPPQAQSWLNPSTSPLS